MLMVKKSFARIAFKLLQLELCNAFSFKFISLEPVKIHA